jgi:hypothetical protein
MTGQGLVDFHVHIGRMFREEHPPRAPLTVHQLVDRMNREGIETAVLLALESPEGLWGYSLTEHVIAARDEYPERLVAFCSIDPRYPMVGEFIEHAVTNHGCQGFGEHVCGLPIDHELCHVIYRKCDEHGLPLVVEISDTLCFDEPGLPGLERCLKQYPNIRWVGHGQSFWSAISAEDPRTGYPEGPVVPGGALDRLMETYPNLYADISAGSGHNAMTRDPDFTAGFIERHWRKLLFGTDYLSPGDELPILRWIHGLDVDDETRRAIGGNNARELLGMG